MIPNHPQFIAAITGKKKVWVRFYSTADNGVLEHVCAPMDYGPGGETHDGLNRYWLWDYTSNTNTGTHILGLVPQQIVDLQVLGEAFDPADFGVRSSPWRIPRNWGSPSTPASKPMIETSPSVTLPRTESRKEQPARA
jgi:hypothetical protein